MVDKSNEYGFVPSSPTQANQNNTGVFEVNDIVDLLAAGQWSGDYGKLELIQTQEITSSTPYLDFINLANTNYDVHFLTLSNVGGTQNNYSLQLRFSTDNGSTFVSTGYQYAGHYNDSSGSFGESKSTNDTGFFSIANITLNKTGGSYMYLYNLLDSTKYSFSTWQSFYETTTVGGIFRSYFVSGVLPTATTHNAFRLIFNTGNIDTLVASLYGIKES